jgi:hypothetical protein
MHSFAIAIAAAVVLGSGFTGAARAQSETPLALSCTGTITNKLSNKVDKLTLSVVLNFQAKKLTGLGRGWEGDILSVDEISVSFVGHSHDDYRSSVIDGTIDRVSGALTASAAVFPRRDTLQDALKDEPVISVSYDLLCKPAQRLF